MLSFIVICCALAAGHFLRMKLRILQRLYLPSCVIGGIFALIVLQFLSPETKGSWTAGWSKLPGFLINIVFACLFLGIKIPSMKQVWDRSSTQVAYGQIVAWGQYAVGVGAWLLLLRWIWPQLPAMFGGVLPVGFEGGHGTAGGLAPVFEQYDWIAGKDFALASATFGILGAIIVGMILVNWAARKGYTVKYAEPVDLTEDDTIGVIPIGQRPSAGRLTVNSDAIESTSLHLAIVGIACLIGYLIKQGLVGIEASSEQLSNLGLLKGFPLFPLCMIGGIIIQLWEDKFDKHNLIDLGIMRRIQNTALDFLVVAAIATIKLSVVVQGLLPLVILVTLGILWNVVCVMFLARRVFKDSWFERSIAEMGQSMGVTATGLLLLRVVDPDYETPAADAFACKQIVHEPFMGGGLWTGMAIPLLAIKGGWFVFIIALAAIFIWSIVILALKKASSS
ncbi:MAG: sodium/glutamate symporter [Sedimentisphaeraceae bacterium JB056]